MSDDELDAELLAFAGDEEEEGEASSVAPSPNSLGSGAMSESDSDRDDRDDHGDGVLYPLEGKYIDEKDKANIMAMSQLEREKILGERAEEVESKKFSAELIRRNKQSERETLKFAEKKKRKASTADLEDNQRKSSRQKIKTSEPLEAYKRERAERGQLRKRQNDRRERERRSQSHDKVGSDVDAEGESEESDGGAKKTQPIHEEPTAVLRDFQRIRIGRTGLADVCFYPGFEKAVNGAFVRVGTGVDHHTGRTLYKMAQIKGFTEGKPYQIEDNMERKYWTDQYVIAQHGNVQKEWPFTYCSNSKFTEADYETFKKALAANNLKLHKRLFLLDKNNDLNKLLERRWTDADIQKKIDRQNKFAHLDHPTITVNTAPKADQSARLDLVNKANRKANSEQIRKALIEERRAQLREREARERKRKQKEEEEKAKLLKPPKSNLDDLFDGSDRSRSGTPSAVNKGSGKNTPIGKSEKKGGIPTFKKRNMDDDIISSMDLGIEIDI